MDGKGHRLASRNTPTCRALILGKMRGVLFGAGERMTNDKARKRDTRAGAAGTSYAAAHNATRRMFLPSTKILIKSAEIRVHRDPARGWNLHEAYYAKYLGIAEAAWVRWEVLPDEDFDGWPNGLARVLQLACEHCTEETLSRCSCDIAWCGEHMTQHGETEHLAPGADRYRAAMAADPALRRYGPARTKPISGLYPRDLRLDHLRPASKHHDTIRVLESIRRSVTYDPSQPDQLLDALRSAAGRGTVPTSTQARWLAADILARCTWPAVLDAVGRHDSAAWMRRQPAITSRKTTPLTQRVEELDRDMNVLDSDGQARLVGLMAASDALAGLSEIVPSSIGLGAFGYVNSVCAKQFARLLTQADGPERVGRAVARAQHDGVQTMLVALAA